MQLSAVFFEVSHKRRANTFESIAADLGEIECLVRAWTKLDPERVFQDNANWLDATLRSSKEHPPCLPELSQILVTVTQVLETCPVAAVKELGSLLAAPEVVARYLVACEALSRFVRRNDPSVAQRLTDVGPDYATGKASLENAAQILGVNVADAVALLEDFGYSRSLERVALSDEARGRLYAALRHGRLTRSGQPASSARKILRDVVATILDSLHASLVGSREQVWQLPGRYVERAA